MPVPTAITDLSTTAAGNSPAGSDSVGPDLDAYLRAHAKFIADLHVGTLTLDNKTFSQALVNAASPMGYTTGAGGQVTQLTSKSTSVTINEPSGQITMDAATLAAGSSVAFTVNNSLVTTESVAYATGSYLFNSPNDYAISVLGCDLGSFRIKVTNTSAGDLSEAVVINFVVFAVATS